MQLEDMKDSKKRIETEIDSLLTKLEVELNERLKKRSEEILSEIKDLVARDVVDEMTPVIGMVSKKIEKLLEEIESEFGIYVVGVRLERIDAGTLEQPYRSIIGGVNLTITI